MKIFLLNTNNFGGLDNAKPKKNDFPSWTDYNAERRIFQDDPLRATAAEKIIRAVEREAPDVIVFQEFDVNAPAGKTAVKWFIEHEYQPAYPDKESEAEIFHNASITMMFVKKQLHAVPYASPKIKEWRWCIAKISNFKIVGVHVPSEKAFLDELKEYAMTHKFESLIVLGDFNIATNAARAKKIAEELEDAKKAGNKKEIAACEEFFERRRWLLETMTSVGCFDAVKGGQVTYFPAKTTVDHVLVSESLAKNVRSVKVFTQEELELSDHAVIVADIQEEVTGQIKQSFVAHQLDSHNLVKPGMPGNLHVRKMRGGYVRSL